MVNTFQPSSMAHHGRIWPRKTRPTLLLALIFAVIVVRGDSTVFAIREEVTSAAIIGGGKDSCHNVSVGPFSRQLPCFFAKRDPDAKRPSLRSILQKSMHPIRVGFWRAFHYDSVAMLRGISSPGMLQREYYSKSFCGNRLLSSNILDTFRGGGQVKTKKKSSSSSKSSGSKKKKSHHESPLSASKPFFPVEAISTMTLSDVGSVFEYAIKSTHSDFDLGQFTSTLEPRVKSALRAMDHATALSRGANVRIPVVASGGTSRAGEIDTFNFCAAMRILTEWRMVRQVPEGYKSFSVSMKMGHKDVVKNIGKMEEAAHEYIDYQKKKLGASEIFSPTLRDLLQFEIDMEAHPSLPRLKEVSGAMGLLWVRRQLHFQLAFFENAFNKEFPSSSEAFQAAYAQVYRNYHGRAIKNIFNYSLQGAPELKEVYKCMNPRRLQEVRATPRHLIAASLLPPDHGRNDRAKNRLGLRKPSGAAQAPAPAEKEILDDELVEQWIASEMERDAHDHIESFLGVAQPLLRELAEVFDEFNMDDPKKV